MDSIRLLKAAGCILLLYKDARCDMKILDEVFGPLGWEREHQVINGNLFCTIRVYDVEKGMWVSKQDVGTESNTEKEKGQASDSFKRACFNLGIGRELYTAPFIWISLNQGEYSERNNRLSVNSSVRFRVKDIDYNEASEISSLEIVDNKNIVRYKLGDKTPESTEPMSNNQDNKNTSSNKYKCEKCGAEISEKVANYSKSKLGHSLCMACQKK
ncbi:MAG: hypothetical protein K0S61_4917 [Anaerocolumna sp.]|nr:hypothetical protein [Anaerocolumna sp.]